MTRTVVKDMATVENRSAEPAHCVEMLAEAFSITRQSGCFFRQTSKWTAAMKLVPARRDLVSQLAKS